MGQSPPLMPGPQALAFARHKESSGLFVSERSPPVLGFAQASSFTSLRRLAHTLGN